MKSFILAIVFLSVSAVLHAQKPGSETAGKEQDQVFTKVESPSDYKLGKTAFQRYLIKNLRYPEDARKNKITGVVTVKFIVTKLGTDSQVEAISGPEPLRSEAVRLIKESGQWKPLSQCGRYVSSFKTEDIVFKL